MLSAWNVEFEPINVHGNAEAQAELKALGIPLVPATVVGERSVHGWNPAALAELVGVDYDDTPGLKPRELAESLETILYYTQHVVKGADAAQLALKHPERNRELGVLVHHIFRLSLAFVDAMHERRFPQAWLTEEPPASMLTGEALAAYGEEVRLRIREWFSEQEDAALPALFREDVPTYYGTQSAHHLLERTAWHAGQHLRQVCDLLAREDALPISSLPEAVFEGLPMPESVW